jgi:hypothetical protein
MTIEDKYQNERDVAEELFGYSPCLHCKNKGRPGSGTCVAFPNKIPDEIFWGKNLHKEPYPGDRGILFVSSD